MNLNTVRVFVRDIDSAKRFYGEALGLQQALTAASTATVFFGREPPRW